MQNKLRDANEDSVTVFIKSVETAMSPGIASGHVVAVIRKMRTRSEAGSFADDLVAFDDQLAARLYGIFARGLYDGLDGHSER